MAKASPAVTHFTAGELSPALEGRIDAAKYGSGCLAIENFIPLVQGPARRRSGTRFVRATKNQGDRIWLSRFIFSVTQSFVLEWGDHYLRFYTNHGIVLSGGVPYEIATPYSVAELTDTDGLFALDFTQKRRRDLHLPSFDRDPHLQTFTDRQYQLGLSQRSIGSAARSHRPTPAPTR